MFSEKKNTYSFTELFNGNDSIQGCFDIAVAEQDAPADLVCADLAVVHPVGERHEMRRRWAVSRRVRYFVSVFGCAGRNCCNSSRRDSRIIFES